MKKICFICTGNTCRSPMAEKLLKYHLKENKIFDVDVASKGLSVNNGDVINSNSVKALRGYGIKSGKRKAKQLTLRDLNKTNTIFITMTQSQKEPFKKFKNVYSFSEIVGSEDINDPYGYNENVYRTVASQLYSATKKLSDKIIKENIW